MKIKEYTLLKKFLNKSLAIHKDNVILICHNNLHLIREHPVFLEKYESIFSDNLFKFIINSFYKFIHGILTVFYSFRNLYQSNKFSKSLNNSDDILFISHFLNKSILGKDDFYYGKLPELIKGKNTILYINHQNKWFNNLNQYWPHSNTNRVLLSKNTNIINELFLIFNIMFSFFKYFFNIYCSKSFLEFKINIFLVSTFFSNSSLFNLRMYYQFLFYFKKVKVKSVIFTFEGHAWEKLLVLAARKSGIKKIIAYQHANISKFQNSIFQFHGIYKVDKILSSNRHGFIRLGKIYNNVSLIGSLRIKNRFKANNFKLFKNSKNFNCLIVPDGILSECINLFHLSIEAARLNDNINFIWRLHPLITFEMIHKKINLNSLPKNIILSKNSIDTDIGNSSWFIYRASTAALPAALSGLRPIFLPKKNTLQIDPLYFLDKDWKKFCSNGYSLIKIINKDIKSNFKDHISNKNLNFLNNKFKQSFDFNMFKRILSDSN